MPTRHFRRPEIGSDCQMYCEGAESRDIWNHRLRHGRVGSVPKRNRLGILILVYFHANELASMVADSAIQRFNHVCVLRLSAICVCG